MAPAARTPAATLGPGNPFTSDLHIRRPEARSHQAPILSADSTLATTPSRAAALIEELLAAASQHAASVLEDALCSVVLTSTPSVLPHPSALSAQHAPTSVQANAYAAAVEGNARLARDLAARMCGDRTYPGRVDFVAAAGCAERIGQAASTCGAHEGAASIVYQSFACATALHRLAHLYKG